MKNIIIFLTCFFIVTACSKQYTFSTDYNKSTDFKVYKTFTIVDYYKFKTDVDPVVNSDLNKGRMIDVLTKEMEERGYRLASKDKSPDLLVKFRTDVQTRQEFVRTNTNNNWGYGYGYYNWRYNTFPNTGVRESVYDEMNLVIDIVDFQKNTLVWQGWAFQKLGKKKDNVAESLQKMTLAMFEEYPIQKNIEK